MNRKTWEIGLVVSLVFVLCPGTGANERMTTDSASLPGGWIARAPRDELRPTFSYEPNGGAKRTGGYVIQHDGRDGLDGWIEKPFPVTGGSYYRFRALRKLAGVALPRRSALVRVCWQDASGKPVMTDVPPGQTSEGRPIPSAEPEHPTDEPADSKEWTTVTGLYRAPSRAARAIVELHLQWAPGGRAEWSDIGFELAETPPRRTVRLAAVHYRPSGKSPLANCEEYAPLITEAARQRADLVVLGETVPAVSVNLKPHETAEPVPGPTTRFFGGLAKNHKLHIVVSLYERERHLVYNTAVLIGPDGSLLGKYRKTCLPHAEVESGIAPGNDYPVFDTAIGKIGMMVCYDGFFPEVARELTNRGAEIIAWPVWGCDPLLARARACENRVYIVSSTYMEPKQGWMLSAIYDREGTPLAKGEEWGAIVVAEVDLGQPLLGPYNLGDFRSMIQRHRPPIRSGDATYQNRRNPVGRASPR